MFPCSMFPHFFVQVLNSDFFQILQVFIDIVINHRKRFQPTTFKSKFTKTKYFILHICCGLFGSNTCSFKIVCFILATLPYDAVSVIRRTITVLQTCMHQFALAHHILTYAFCPYKKGIIASKIK